MTRKTMTVQRLTYLREIAELGVEGSVAGEELKEAVEYITLIEEQKMKALLMVYDLRVDRRNTSEFAAASVLGNVERELCHIFTRLPKCSVYSRYCNEHNFEHGAEAEELRKGIESLIKKARNKDFDLDVVSISSLERLLDKVDARDSLAHGEHTNDEEEKD